MTKTTFQDAFSEEIWKSTYKDHNDVTIDDTMARIANAAASVEDTDELRLEWSAQFFDLLSNFKATSGGRIYANAGTEWGGTTLMNCFVAPRRSHNIDSLDGILLDLKNQANTLKAEGGWGQNFSYIRPRGTFIAGVGVESPGSVKFMEMFDKSSEIITAGSGKKSTHKKAKGKIRKGAMMGVLDCWHPDIIEFITAKQTPGRLTKFNTSVNCTDDFMGKVNKLKELKAQMNECSASDKVDIQLAIDKTDVWDLRFPDTTHAKYKPSWTGNLAQWISDGYPTITHNTISVSWLWNLMMESTYNRAEPGILFMDRANHFGPLYYAETIGATNPCGEQTLAPGGVCNLGSLNLSQFINKDRTGFNMSRIKKYIRILVRFLDNISTLSDAPLKEYVDSMRNKRRIGCGILGWGSALFMIKVRFGSDRAAELREEIMSTIAREAYMTSIDLAIEKGMFSVCEPVKHAAGHFVQSLGLSGSYMNKLKTTGIRNSSLLSIQPTGNTSILANVVSGGLEPVFMPEYIRTIIVSETPDHLIDVTPKWSEGEFHSTPFFKKAKEGDEDILRGTDDSGVVYKIDKNRGLTKEVLCEDYGVRFLKNIGEWDPNADWAVTTTNLTVDAHVRDLQGFARWVDSAMSKCIAEGTLITTNKGIVPIESIGHHAGGSEGFVSPNDEYTILDENGDVKKITSHYFGKKKPCSSITFGNGFNLIAAHTHMLKTEDGWKTVRDLKVGEIIHQRTVSTSPLNDGEYQQTDDSSVLIPTTMDEDFSLLMGMWVASGSLTNKSMSLGSINQQTYNVGRQLILSLFGPSDLIGSRSNDVSHVILSKPLSNWVGRHFGRCGDTKDIPSIILKSPTSVRMAFIEGLMCNSKGNNTSTLVLFDGYSIKVAEKLTYLLSSLGAQFLLTRVLNDNNKTKYVVTVKSDTSGCVIFDDNKLTSTTIMDIHDVGIRNVYDVEVEDTHSYLINGIVSHNTINVPNDYPFGDFENIYLDSYNTGHIKGVTSYRSGSMSTVLSAKNEGDVTSDDEEIIKDDVKLPASSPAVMKTIKAEGKKWYITIVYHNDNHNKPFALFVKTNNNEKNIVANEAIEKLMALAKRKQIPKRHRDVVESKLSNDNNPSKVARLISFLLRHGVLIKNVVATLDTVEEAYAGSFVFHIKKFLGTYIKDGEKVENETCHECGNDNIVFREGCKICMSCGSSKCG